MHSPWFGEFLGTLVLVLLGNGVNAGVNLRKSYAADSG
jgi:glycerol uptake facilitator protein